MKIHFEGTHKEMQRVSLFLEECDDLIVMETSLMQEKDSNSNYYYIDVEAVSSIPKKGEMSLYDCEMYSDDREEYENVPSSLMHKYKELFQEVKFYVLFRHDTTREDIEKKVKELCEEVKEHKDVIKNFEIYGGVEDEN